MRDSDTLIFDNLEKASRRGGTADAIRSERIILMGVEVQILSAALARNRIALMVLRGTNKVLLDKSALLAACGRKVGMHVLILSRRANFAGMQ